MAEQTAELASDHRLVAFRERLTAARDDDTPFGEAWQRARAELLTGLARPDRKSWSIVLASTRPAWLAAYYGSASGWVDCVTELEAFALDSEAGALRYEPVG